MNKFKTFVTDNEQWFKGRLAETIYPSVQAYMQSVIETESEFLDSEGMQCND